MANLLPLIFCDVSKCGIGNPTDEISNVSKCGIGNPTDEISNEKVFRPTSDYNILRTNRDELKARLKPIKCNVFVDKTQMEFYKKYPSLDQAVEDDCNYILQEVYKEASAKMTEFIIKSDFVERETIETEHGTEYRFRLTIWAEPRGIKLMGCLNYECKYNDHEKCTAYREDDEKLSCETKAKAPMLRFMLDGCDISYAAEAPADMTLAQLLKQCDRIHPNWCACGIRSTDDKPELIFWYDRVDYVRGETGYAACSIDGVNPPECQYCKYLEATYEASEYEFVERCGNKNSRYYGCLRDAYNTCELQEDKNA